HKVRSISSGYDRQLIKLQQMGVAMAGWRFAEGAEAWADQNPAQQKFANYDLESYDKGDLDHDVMPRELVPMTTMERMMLINAKKTTLEVIPLVELIEEAGYLREDAEKWVAEADAKKAENQAKMLALGETQEPSEATPDIPRPTGAPPGGPQRGRTSAENQRGNAA
ncbi:MAG: hypothetical protein M3P94_06975, partial [Chloroflexota bacterium]|nr:hypothetical protein [Chloroflexota bacterium]